MEIVKEARKEEREDTVESLQEFLEQIRDHIGDEARELLTVSALLRELSDNAKLSAKELRGLGLILSRNASTIKGELPCVPESPRVEETDAR